MRVLVTGGTGYIGSHLVDALIKRGDEVLVIDNLSTGRYENIRHLQGNPAFRFINDTILKVAGGPYAIDVASGAMGIGCNGIHWINFALHLAGQDSGRLLFGEVEETAIGSGRGPQYRDYGGRGLFAFPDGSRWPCCSAGPAPSLRKKDRCSGARALRTSSR